MLMSFIYYLNFFCFLFLGIYIRSNIFISADTEIVRPPLHHFLTCFQMLCFMNISPPYSITRLVTHLAIHLIPDFMR